MAVFAASVRALVTRVSINVSISSHHALIVCPQLPALVHVGGHDGDAEQTAGGVSGVEVTTGEEEPEPFLDAPCSAELAGRTVGGEDLLEPLPGAV